MNYGTYFIFISNILELIIYDNSRLLLSLIDFYIVNIVNPRL